MTPSLAKDHLNFEQKNIWNSDASFIRVSEIRQLPYYEKNFVKFCEFFFERTDFKIQFAEHDLSNTNDCAFSITGLTTIYVTGGRLDRTGPLACLSPFPVKQLIRSDFLFRTEASIFSFYVQIKVPNKSISPELNNVLFCSC